MATNTMSGSVGYGVTLGSAYASPLTITATDTINNAGAVDALHANYSGVGHARIGGNSRGADRPRPEIRVSG